MRDLRSFTGINSTQNIFAVAPNAEFILFKKTSRDLYYFNPNCLEMNQILTLVCIDDIHTDDTIFDIFFHDSQLVIALQNPVDNGISFALCSIESSLVIATEIKPSKAFVKNSGGFSRIINDELGPVFISFPSTFTDSNVDRRTIEIFHVGDFLSEDFNRIKRLPIQQRSDGEELWCDPFISRNVLYFFNRYNQQLLTISATDHYLCKTLQTRPLPNGKVPCRHFVHRSIIVFENFAFVFFSQLIETGHLSSDESTCQAWKLHLNSLQWEPLDLFLSHHIPKSKVAIRSSGANPEKVFIHGGCNVSGCSEQVHLYELDFSVSDQIEYTQVFTERSIDTCIPVPAPVEAKSKSTPAIVEYINVAREMFAKNKAPSTKPKIILRKEKGYSNASSLGSATNESRLSTPSLQSCLTNSSASSAASNLSGIMNWSRQLSLEPMFGESPQLSEQLANAKMMGFSDNEIMAAISMNNKHNKDKVFTPFRSTDHMVEILSLVQKVNASPDAIETKASPPPRYLDRYSLQRSSDEDAENDPNADVLPPPENAAALKFPAKWTSSALSPRSASVNRSASFTNAHHTYTTSPLLRRPRSGYYLQSLGGSTASLNASANSNAVSRLIETFNNERKGLIEEFAKVLDDMKRKNKDNLSDQRELKTKLGHLEEENEKLKMQLRDRDMLEQRYDHLEMKNKQLGEQLDQKFREMEELETQVNSIPNFAQELDECRQQRDEKEHEIIEYRNQINSLQRELSYLAEPAEAIAELQNDLLQLKLENKDYREKQAILACTTCMDQPRNILFMPCLHFTCCSSCAYKTDHCSICRTRIMGKVEVYQ